MRSTSVGGLTDPARLAPRPVASYLAITVMKVRSNTSLVATRISRRVTEPGAGVASVSVAE